MKTLKKHWFGLTLSLILISVMVTLLIVGPPDYYNDSHCSIGKALLLDSLPAKAKPKYYSVEATCYNCVKKQTDKTPFITADGFKLDSIHPFKNRVIGMTRDLLVEFGGGPFCFGDTVMVMGTWVYDGKWVVHDTGGDKIKNRIDFCIDNKMFSSKWGKVIITGL